MARASPAVRTAAPRLRLYLLGSFRVESETGPIHLPTRKIESLLAFLVLHPEAHSREKLAALLWGDVTDAQARHSLRTALNTLRKQLGDELVLADRESVQLNPDCPQWVDAREIEDIRFMVSDLSHQSEIINLQSTLTLYHGDLLADFYDDWILVEREKYRTRFLDTMLEIVQAFRSASEYERAIEFAQRVLTSDPVNERAHQHLMFCYLAIGDRTAALQQFDTCQLALQTELGVEPSRETIALCQWIKQAPSERTSPAALITNLPIPLSSFIGRKREMTKIKQRLKSREDTAPRPLGGTAPKSQDGTAPRDVPDVPDEGGRMREQADSFHPSSFRLLTLVGAGGSGKTRLAIRVATDLIDHFGDGVWWLDLAPLSDEALVPQALAKALGVREIPNEALTETLTNFLRSKQLLLVLDNCEHLVSVSAQLAHDLLNACPHLKILATSREALGITGETVYQVPTLSLPDAQSLSLTELLMQHEGVHLFVERARAVKSDFTLTEQNATPLAQVCQRLDGIPLAIELAAARTKLLTLEQIAARLGDRFNLLTTGSRTALPRHQTLRAAIDWSYDLLPDDAKKLFRRLSVFGGGFTLDAAEVVCTDEQFPASALLNELARLVDGSLVLVEQRDESKRYRMLETIREYAREKLEETGEAGEIRDRHLEYLVGLAEKAESNTFGAESVRYFKRLDQELDNIRAAMDWTIQTRRAITAFRLAAALNYFWAVGFYYIRANSILIDGMVGAHPDSLTLLTN